MITKSPLAQPERLVWVDVLRVVACFLVVLAHSCDPYVGKFDAAPDQFMAGTAWGSLVRSCVPLFTMMSGVLLLPVNMDTSIFYKKRLSRVILPLVFWGIVTPVLYVLYVNSATLPTNLSVNDFNWDSAVHKILTFPINFNYDITPLWYLYMLVGIYLFMPIISPWLRESSQKDIKCFLWIWGFSMIIPYIVMFAPYVGYEGNYGSTGILGVCLWNPYGMFYYFSGFLGYVVLAYYLVRFPLNWSLNKTLAITLPLFALGYFITFWGFVTLQRLYPGNYEQLEIVWYFTGINVFMMTFSVFVLMQRIKIKNNSVAKFINGLAKLTFGVYLCHFLLVQIGYDVVYNYIPLPYYLQVPLVAILAYTASTAVVWVLAKLPKSKYIIG